MAKQTRVISVVGKKNSGKTTMIVALVREFVRKRNRVGTIKHGTHPVTADREGTDTWHHFHEGKAERVMIEGPEQRVFFERTKDDPDPVDLVRRFMAGLDVVILEGFTKSNVPKIEAFRRSQHDTLRFDPSLPNASSWIAVVTDDLSIDVPFPKFSFSDTAWLVAIRSIAWDAALLVDT